MRKILTILFAIILISFQGTVMACTGFTASEGDLVLFGNNEDWYDPDPYIRIHPAEQNKHGRLYIEFGWPPENPRYYVSFTGINDQGLCFDSFLHPTLVPTGSSHKPRFNGDLMEHCMETCSTVEEVLTIFDQYNLDFMADFQYFIVDRFGNSAIIEGDEIIYREGNYQVITNSLQSDPDHGWYPEWCNPTPVCKEYLKVDTNITLKAYDLPDNECNTSIESIFWRYEYLEVSYPLEDTPGTWNGIVIAEAYGYEDPDIEDFWWYRVDDDTANVSFDEGCRHDLFYWAKDNVCHKSGIYEKTFFVDNETPEIELEFLGHGYYKDQYCNEYLKGNESFIITATDFPDNECESGIEGIFWRYEYEGVSYPMEDDPEGWNGTGIAAKYHYTDPNIIDHWWYYTDSYETFFEFKEQCQHDLYFWAKDNVCNPSPINHTTFYVVDTEPTLMLNVSGHG